MRLSLAHGTRLLLTVGVCALGAAWVRSTPAAPAPADLPLPAKQVVTLPGATPFEIPLAAGQAVGVQVQLSDPVQLPDNARVRASWQLVAADPAQTPRGPADGEPTGGRAPKEFGIAPPTADGSKLLHALDTDLYLIYRAPVAGKYRLTIAPETAAVDLFEKPRWRESGHVPQLAPAPLAVAWPESAKVDVAVAVRNVDLQPSGTAPLYLEAEPNDAPELAQLLALPSQDAGKLHVIGTADDVEYFDNGDVGTVGDDWFRVEFTGPEPRLLTACLSIVDQQLAAQIRCYSVAANEAVVTPGKLLPIKEYTEGNNPNERAHQQVEQHRIAINRLLQPGRVYFLRVEANAPAYELELRLLKPAPFTDPRLAVQHGLYDHIGQVNAWLANRPRGGSLDRRIRDTGNLLGTNCMSCHTQSGVWGPAIPFAQGYRPENVILYRDLVNISYQSMRPTNKLVDAANNTSLAPLDLGDGPAGTRVAGHAIASYEKYQPPRKLQAKQAIRAANFVLQSGDPGGVNAAGPGANVGQGVVYNYAGEILYEAWRATDNPHYFHALVEKATRMLQIDPKFTDDMCHRVEFLTRFFPRDYPTVASRMAAVTPTAAQDRVKFNGPKLSAEEAAKLWEKIQTQIQTDLARLRQIQNADGSWHFNPGASSDGGKTWQAGTTEKDPAPTALALIAFQAVGVGPDDPTVKKGVAALLAMQHPTGYWNAASQTGFVTTSYSLHALSRLFPTEPAVPQRDDYILKNDMPATEAIRRTRLLSHVDDAAFIDLMLTAAQHPEPFVRYWACVALGNVHQPAGVPALLKGIADPIKPVREAAHWGLRQTLIDDHGWPELFAALQAGDARTREALYRTLVMKVDAVLPGSTLDFKQLTAALAAGLNDDPHPGARAWASKAAWQWWVWNPPTRPALNEAWVKLLQRDEKNLIVENCHRYQTQALFIANGHKANGSGDHQYTELQDLFVALDTRLAELNEDDPAAGLKLARRLMAVAATFYTQSGGDGGPGQMGYSTPGSGELFGEALLTVFKTVPKENLSGDQLTLLTVGLEGAANVPHQELQEKLIDYSLHGPEDLRGVAASSVSDPRSTQLVAVPELLEPLLEQVKRGANEPARRGQLSDPLLRLFARVKWVVPQTVEQQREMFAFLAPKFEKFQARAEIEKLPQASDRHEAFRQMDAAWYLASGLGDALGENPDLHVDSAFESFPAEFKNPLQARYWLPSVNWILTYKTMLPEVKVEAGQLPPVDPFEEPRSRALMLYLSQLKADADERTREIAVRMATQTALRRNPEVLNALDELVKFEKRDGVVQTAKNVLSQGRDNFQKDLAAALKNETPKRVPVDDQGNAKIDAAFLSDFTYFQDYVMPEMSRVLRGDQRSCMACHGVPGRVPPLTLHKPDDAGYLPVDKTLANYRLLQDRVNVKDVETSKLLRKPLNVQTGQEDGHQGGRRYQPQDPGYQILRKWALNQIELQKTAAGTE